jgi:hypothetical protein
MLAKNESKVNSQLGNFSSENLTCFQKLIQVEQESQSKKRQKISKQGRQYTPEQIINS